MSMNPKSAMRSLGRLLRSALAARRYKHALSGGEAAGNFSYVARPWPIPDSPLVELRLRADGPNAVSSEAAETWCERQTLPEVVAVGFDNCGREVWRVPDKYSAPPPEPPALFAAPGHLPDVLPAHLESALLIAAAEGVDAVVLRERVETAVPGDIESADPANSTDLRPWGLYRASAFRWDPLTDEINPRRTGLLVKLIDQHGEAQSPRTPLYFSPTRRGPYLSDVDLGPHLEVPLRDASLMQRRPMDRKKPAVLVMVPFLARGGAEHTLFETMRALTDRYDFSIVTLAPHQPHLGDRREDFRQISERLYCLGDLVHPDAMFGILGALLDSLGAETIYNANSTTLFYDFAPRLKRERPEIRIVDHLYDHRVGYIDRYTPELLGSVDLCVAENHRIAEVLTEERGWPANRVPVIWPCGRARDSLPPIDQQQKIRTRIRGEIGIGEDDVLFFAAARMHPQKRPLDFVSLAERVSDLDTVHFLIAGGGDLEGEVDAAIARSAGARIRRLPFRTDIPELIVAADVGFLVSDFEGLPVFLLECLQLGRPFLGTRVGDLGTVLDETGAGVVIDRPGDLDSLEGAVRSLADPVFRSKLAENAVSAGARFDVEACASSYATAFDGDR